jgi:hypothetical protein
MLLPGLLRIRPGLTSLAAVRLLLGATVLTPVLLAPEPVLIAIPAAVGLLAAIVAYGRWPVSPLRGR